MQLRGISLPLAGMPSRASYDRSSHIEYSRIQPKGFAIAPSLIIEEMKPKRETLIALCRALAASDSAVLDISSLKKGKGYFVFSIGSICVF